MSTQKTHKTLMRRARSEYLPSPLLLSLLCNSSNSQKNDKKTVTTTQQNLSRYRHSHPNEFQSKFYINELRCYCVQCNPIFDQNIILNSSTENLINKNEESFNNLSNKNLLNNHLNANTILLNKKKTFDCCDLIENSECINFSSHKYQYKKNNIINDNTNQKINETKYRNRLRKSRLSCGADLGYSTGTTISKDFYLENYYNNNNNKKKTRSCSNDSSASLNNFFYSGPCNHMSFLYSLVSLKIFFIYLIFF